MKWPKKNKRNKVNKSINYGSPSTYMVLDNNGNLMTSAEGPLEEQMKKNSSLQTIINKQASIVSEARTTIKDKSESKDPDITNSEALKFLEWIESPNTYPAPTTRHEIFDHIINEYFKRGLSGIIFNFNNINNEISVENWRNTSFANSIYLNNVARDIRYEVMTGDQENLVFKMSPEYPGLFVNRTESIISVLFVSGNYNVKKCLYETPFADMGHYIVLQNLVIDFASSFYKNACFPAMIVQLTYKDLEPGRSLGREELREFQDAVKEVKKQVMKGKGSSNAGQIIVPEHPSLEIDIKPLSIPTNAEEAVRYDNWATRKIIATVDGGSQSAFEGENEYSNNAIVKLEDLYDGTLRMFKKIVIDKMNNFMKSLFIVMKIPVDTTKIYLSIDTSEIKIYQKQETELARGLVKDNLIRINEGRDYLRSIGGEKWDNLEDDDKGDLYYLEFENKTKRMDAEEIVNDNLS